MSTLLAFALPVLGCGATLLARLRDGEFLTPGSALTAAWSISFGLYLMRMLPYGPMPAEAAAVLALGAGCLLAGVRLGRRWCPAIRPEARQAAALEAWLWVYGIAGLTGLAWYLWEVHRLFGFWAFFQQGYEVRSALTEHRIPSHFLFLQLFCVTTPLVAVAALLTGRRLRPGLLLLVAVCVAGTWISTDLTKFYTIVLTVGAMYAYRRGAAFGWKALTGTLVVSGVLLLASFLIVGAWTGKSPRRLGLVLSPPLASSASPADRPGPLGTVLRNGSTVYLYATASYAAFAVWYPWDHPRTHGLHAVYPAARALQRVGLYSGSLPAHIPQFVAILPGVPVPFGWNGYTLLYYPILDFGLPGMIVYCLAVGAFAGAAYQLMRAARTSPTRLLLVAQVTTALVLSIFVNKFNNTAWWYALVFSLAPFTIPPWLGRLRRQS
jgi:hypothetical protein